MTVSAPRLLPLLFVVSLAWGCATPGASGAPDEADRDPYADDPYTDDDADSAFDPEIEALAADYLFADIDDAASRGITARILNLDFEEQREFREAVIDLQPDDSSTDQDAAVARIREIHEAAIAAGVNMFELTSSEFEMFVADTYGFDLVDPLDPLDVSDGEVPPPTLCFPGYASCSTSSFPNSVSDPGYCPASYVRPTASDRVSNSSCELLACDYRLRYTTSSRKSYAVGATTAADCVMDYYGGSLISSQSGSYQYVLSGVGGPSRCLITTGSTLWSSIYIF